VVNAWKAEIVAAGCSPLLASITLESLEDDSPYVKTNMPAAERGILIADGVVSEALRSKLETTLDLLASRRELDYQPRTKRRVFNYIDPSLYCYIEGVSYVPQTADQNNEESRRAWFQSLALQQVLEAAKNEFDEEQLEKFLWLPSEFYYTPTEGTKILSYINNLSRTDSDVYQTIASIFDHCVTSLEHVRLAKLLLVNL